MKAKARHALAVIRQCVHSGRYLVLRHFAEQMDQRGLFWPDIECVIASPASVEDAGKDRFGRPKWIICGAATDGLDLGIVCALDVDEAGNVTVFITAYWQED